MVWGRDSKVEERRNGSPGTLRWNEVIGCIESSHLSKWINSVHLEDALVLDKVGTLGSVECR